MKNITIELVMKSANVVFGNTVESFTKENGWTCYTFGNAKRRAERVQIWHDTQTGKCDIYMGTKTAWYELYKLQSNNAHITSSHTPHAKGTELMWHLGSVIEAHNMLAAWAARYGVVKSAVKNAKESVKTAC